MKLLCIVGTRPEAIKMAPIIKALRRAGDFDVSIIASGQHREMLDQTLEQFGIASDVELAVMRAGQDLAELTGRLFPALASTFRNERADMVLAQGDTTTVFVASVAAFYLAIPFGHVEAGLRTGNLRYPFPEEFNRLVTSRIASLHFAPTEQARRNLLGEGVPDEDVVLTGNTVIDALLEVAATLPEPAARSRRNSILMTAHRRESFGEPLVRIFEAIRDLVRLRPDLRVVFPVHPNPNIGGLARDMLGEIPQVNLVGPLGYRDLVSALKSCDLVLTDSGGLQEEAPALGKPVLVLRDETERPEAVGLGVAKLVGQNRQVIVTEVARLLEDDAAYAQMAVGSSPYGDGHAAERIVEAIAKRFKLC